MRAGVALIALCGLSACAESSAVDRVLPYWDRPVASSPSVLQAAQDSDPSGKPFPNLSSVPDRPGISAAERIASLEGELTADLDRAANLRATGGRPASRALDEIDGLDEFTVDPAPDAPSLGRVPAVNLNGGDNTVRLPLARDGAGVAVGTDGLPLRNITAPEPPPRLADIPPPPPTAPPPAPVIDNLPVPEVIDETPPDFVVEPIANAEPASIPAPSAPQPDADIPPPPAVIAAEPPPLDAPAFEPPPVAIDTPPTFDIAAAPNLEPPPVTLEPIDRPELQPAAWLDITPDGVLAEHSQSELTGLIAEGLQEGSRLRYRLVGYADGEAVTADAALGRARLVSDYMQARNIQRGRLILAPPELLSNDPRIGSVAVFVLP